MLSATLALVLGVGGHSALSGSSSISTDPERKSKFSEYEVRAAFLLIFAKYTEWPDNSWSPNFVIGVLGDAPFEAGLENLKSATMKGRKVVVRRFHNVSEIQRCHILYFASDQEPQMEGLREKLMAMNVLTVGETNRFLGLGGALQVFNEEGHLSFVVNRTALNRSHLQVEAMALSLAKRVVERP